MKHARSDYDRIQDPHGRIGADEPVFLLRAQDANAAGAVRAWADLAEANGAQADIVASARTHADEMDTWQRTNRIAKIPDTPEGAVPYMPPAEPVGIDPQTWEATMSAPIRFWQCPNFTGRDHGDHTVTWDGDQARCRCGQTRLPAS